MQKSLIINKPRPGRSTATLVTHVYNQVTKRTQTIYIGSFSVGLDPDLIPVDAQIPSGGRLHGICLSPAARGLEPEDLAAIRVWLEVYGEYRRQEVREFAQAMAAAEGKRMAHDQLRRDVELELRPRIEVEIRERLCEEMRAVELPPMEAALFAIDRAGEYLVEQAALLRAKGHKLSNIRYAGVSTIPMANPLDCLQAQANHVRLQAHAKFEGACKAAAIMASRTRPLAAR